ncbi:MAG: undecaprenyl-phosphate glucose phosphotransferase [Ignavibacteriales bacterium]
MTFGKSNLKVLRTAADIFLIFASFVAAALFAQPSHILTERLYMFLLPVLLSGLWYFSANATGFYDDFNSRYFPYQIVYIIKNIVLQSGAAISFIFLIKEDLYTRNFLIYYTVLLSFFVSAEFLYLRHAIRRQKRKGINFRNLLIAGAGKTGRNFRDMIEQDISLGYSVIGFLDNDTSGGNEIMGRVDQLEAIAKNQDIDEVVIALPGERINEIEEIMRVCNKLAIRAYIIPDYFKFLSRKFQVGLIGSFPIITVRNEPLQEIHWQFIKRAFDLTISILALLLLASWFFPLIILLQKILSPGPVFYVQDRLGKDNRIFRCYKFRSMVPTGSDRVFMATATDDPRITRFGRFMRKANIDELPQLLNVLFGDMSLVGPRPHALNYNKKYEEYIEALRLRNLVKPGITGWAQIHGLRGDVEDEEENKARIQKRFEYDVWYVENWTFGLDLQIIFLTFWEILKGKAQGV